MQNNLRTVITLAAAGAALGQASALEPSDLLLFQKGPAVLKPQFSLSETFNDNITYRSQDKQADLLTIVSPGLELQLGRKDFNFFDLAYTYDRLIYADHGEFDANQHHIAARLKFQKNRLTLDGNDTVDFFSSPIGGGYSAATLDRTEGISGGVGGLKISRANFYDFYRLTWDMSERTDLYLQGMHSFVDYQDDLPLYDSRTLIGTLGFEYHPFVKTYFFGETYFGQTENSGNVATLIDYPTADFIGFFIGVRGQFTDRLRGMAKAGFEHRFYSDDGPSLNAPVVDIGLEYQMSDKTAVAGGYSRRQYESIQFQRSPYTTDSLYATWTQFIGGDGRLRGIARASYYLSTFDDQGQAIADRTDQSFSASLTMQYDIKVWMRAFGSYNFEHLDSNLPAIVDYNVNRVTVGLQIGY